MYQTDEKQIHYEINDASLVFCTQIAENVKATPYIPFFEVYTYGLVARYFGLTEKRILNAYKTNRYRVENDYAILTGKEITPYAKDVKSLGASYGHLCEFPNGVMAEIAYSQNVVFNSRALLHFAVILRDESAVAKKIYDIFDAKRCKNHVYLERKNQWFLTNPNEPRYAPKAEEKPTEVVCPYMADMAARKEAATKKSEEPQAKETDGAQKPRNTRNAKRCAQLDVHGNVLYTWESGAAAARALGLSAKDIYDVCGGYAKSVGGGTGNFGKGYRFAFVQ